MYSYGDSSWGDLLTAYDGKPITYDGIGNPLTYDGWTFTWEHGRELASMAKNGVTWQYTYDANGMRTSRTNGATTYRYIYNGGQLTQMHKGTDVLHFVYDAGGTQVALIYNGSVYYYLTTLQGDTFAIADSDGTIVVEYIYDAWGNVQSITGSMASTLGTLNPLRYRGYVYDQETGLYYLQSRYYNPTWGRFLNADGLVSTGTGILGYNMFAYCNNNPCNKIDYCGSKPGDLFDTMDEAAKDFAEYINAKSIENNKEYYSYIYTVVEYKTVYVTYVNPNFFGSSIFSGFFNFLFKGQIMKTVKKTVKVVRYTYIEPVQGSKDNVIGPAMAHFLCSKVALLHTHAAYDPRYDNDNFSNTDKQFSNISRVPFYVATPLGTLRRYNPSDRSDALLYSDIPYDPNHPQR